MTGYQQAALPEPPPVDTVAMIDKQRLIEAAEREFRKGHRAMAEAMVTRAGAVRDGQCVPLQPALARRLGLA
jgi:hypothetical protein